MSELKTYVEFWYPGSFVSESSTCAVESREVAKLDVPARAFGFQFFDLLTDTRPLNGASVKLEQWTA